MHSPLSFNYAACHYVTSWQLHRGCSLPLLTLSQLRSCRDALCYDERFSWAWCLQQMAPWVPLGDSTHFSTTSEAIWLPGWQPGRLPRC
jgi:hypothetical protein